MVIESLALSICEKLAEFEYLSVKKRISFNSSLVAAFSSLSKSGVKIDQPGTIYEGFFKQEEVIKELWKSTLPGEEIDFDKLLKIFKENWTSGIAIDDEKVLESLKLFCRELQKNLQKHDEFKLSFVLKKEDALDTKFSQMQLLLSTLENSNLTSEYQKELDYARSLLVKYKPKQALEYLDDLKGRSWHSADGIVKFRILTNQAAAYLSLREEDKAAPLFFEALKYNPNDEKALGNAALAFIILKDYDLAKEKVSRILEINPGNSNAYSLLIQASPETETEELLKTIPEPLQSSFDVAYAFSFNARRQNKLIEAIKWLDIALKKEEQNPEILGNLGSTIIEAILKKSPTPFLSQLTDIDKQEVRRAIEYLDKVLGIISKTEWKAYWVQCISNRSLAKGLLDDSDGAIQDIEMALMEEPHDALLLKNRAIYALMNRDFEKATFYLRRAISFESETSEIPLMLAEALIITDKQSEAIGIIENYLKNDLPVNLEETANRLLAEAFIKNKDFNKAESFLDDLIKRDPKPIYIAEAAQLAFVMGKKEEAKDLLFKAKDNLREDAPVGIVHFIAEELYIQGYFEEAISLYEKLATLQVSLREYAEKLIYCYYYAGFRDRALETCRALRAAYGPSKPAVKIEITIHMEIGNYPEAKRICEEYVNSTGDKELSVELAIINFNLGDIDGVREFLRKNLDVNGLPFMSQLKYAELFSTVGLTKEYVDRMYEIRRRHYEERLIHIRYMGLLINLTNQDNALLAPTEEVTPGSAVHVVDDFGEKTWYVIDDRDDIEKKLNEINLKDSRAQKLLGKKVGDEVVIFETNFRKSTLKLIEIKSKYIHALHSSMSLLQKDSNEKDGLFSIKVDMPEEDGKLPEGMQSIFDSISAQQEIIAKGEEFYKKGFLTIGALASLTGSNIHDVFFSLMSNEVGIKCCNGDYIERQTALAQIAANQNLVLDLTSLLTVTALDKDNTMQWKERFNFKISQSTVNLIHQRIFQLKGKSADGFMSLGKKGDSFIRYMISPEDVKNELESLTRILDWISKNCEILPVSLALKMKRDEKDKIDKLFGESFHDTVLIAKKSGYLLYSEDERLRAYAKQDGVDGIWTQSVLIYSLTNNFITREFYYKAVVKLVCSNFHYTSVDENVIIEAARQSDWMPKHPFTTVVSLLKTSNDSSALMVTTKFLFELWNQQILPEKRDELIFCLLDVSIIGRDRKTFLKKLAYLIKKRFHLIPLAEAHILKIIQNWLNAHLISLKQICM